MRELFDATDLTHNREGRLSPRQLANGAATGFGFFAFWLIVAMLCAAGGAGGAFLFHDTLREPTSRVDLNAVYAIAIGGGLLAFGALVLGGLSFRYTLARRARYAAGTCATVELVFNMPRLKQQFADAFHLAADNHRVFIPRGVGQKFVQGKRYRLYLLNNELLSLEQVD